MIKTDWWFYFICTTVLNKHLILCRRKDKIHSTELKIFWGAILVELDLISATQVIYFKHAMTSTACWKMSFCFILKHIYTCHMGHNTNWLLLSEKDHSQTSFVYVSQKAFNSSLVMPQISRFKICFVLFYILRRSILFDIQRWTKEYQSFFKYRMAFVRTQQIKYPLFEFFRHVI